MDAILRLGLGGHKENPNRLWRIPMKQDKMKNVRCKYEVYSAGWKNTLLRMPLEKYAQIFFLSSYHPKYWTRRKWLHTGNI